MAEQAHHHAFYRGQVFHRRLIDPKYHFQYRVFNLLVDIDHLDALDTRLRFFSHNRFNLFSFYDRDHLLGQKPSNSSPNPLRAWIEEGLKAHGIDLMGGRVELFCYPRMLGFVFNPLSVWYCWDNQDRLQAIVAEVRNTFGERHCYLLHEPGAEAMDLTKVYAQTKRFHVSPFLPVSGHYEFRFNNPGERLDIGIVWIDKATRAMIATQRMEQVPIGDQALLKAFVTLPLMTLKVVLAIHWQALKIWLRGGRFHKKPKPPTEEISSDV